jgi:hypothetical protein
MSGIQNKIIIFFSQYPSDKLSGDCLKEIKKYDNFKNQFIFICIHDPLNYSKPPTIKLPPKIVKYTEHGLIPLLCVPGFKDYIHGVDALNWLTNNSGKNVDDLLGCYSSDINNYSSIEDTENIGSSYQSSDYNMPIGNGKGEVGKDYANIEETMDMQIVTPDIGDLKTEKKRAAIEISAKLEELNNARSARPPPLPPRKNNGPPSFNQMQGRRNNNYETDSISESIYQRNMDVMRR